MLSCAGARLEAIPPLFRQAISRRHNKGIRMYMAKRRAVMKANGIKEKRWPVPRTDALRTRQRRYDKKRRGTARWHASMTTAGHVRRSRVVMLPATFTSQQWAACLADHGGVCAYCHGPALLVGAMQQDHCVPLAIGGGYVQGNIVPACKRCNGMKHTLTTVEFVWRLAKEAVAA